MWTRSAVIQCFSAGVHVLHLTPCAYSPIVVHHAGSYISANTHKLVVSVWNPEIENVCIQSKSAQRWSFQTSRHLPDNLLANKSMAWMFSLQHLIPLKPFYLVAASNYQQSLTNQLGNRHFSLPVIARPVSKPVLLEPYGVFLLATSLELDRRDECTTVSSVWRHLVFKRMLQRLPAP